MSKMPEHLKKSDNLPREILSHHEKSVVEGGLMGQHTASDGGRIFRGAR